MYLNAKVRVSISVGCLQLLDVNHIADLNECQDSPCHEKAICQNVIGSFFCICNEGFMGDGVKSCKRMVKPVFYAMFCNYYYYIYLLFVASLFIEYFSCEKIDSKSIQVNWQIRPKDSSSLDQVRTVLLHGLL